MLQCLSVIHGNDVRTLQCVKVCHGTNRSMLLNISLNEKRVCKEMNGMRMLSLHYSAWCKCNKPLRINYRHISPEK